MLGLKITSTHWPCAQEMKHRSIYFDAQYSTQPMIYVTKSINPFVTDSDGLGDKFIIYANPVKSIVNFAAKLGGILDKDVVLTDIDIATVICSMNREAKAETLQIFFNNSLQGSLNFLILCCTSGVGNAGINSPDIRTVYRIDFPPSIMYICQERGRAGRRPGALPETYSYKLFFSLENFLYLFKRIINPTENVLCPDYRKHQLTYLIYVASLLASKLCYTAEMERRLGNPDVETGLVEACGACTNCGRKNYTTQFPLIRLGT